MRTKLLKEELTLFIDGAEFRRRRILAGKTLKEIANGAGISDSYLCDIELGHRAAKGALAKKLISALTGKMR